MNSQLLTQAFLATAEMGLNRLLKTDGKAIIQLTQLATKVIAIQTSFTATDPLYVIVTEHGAYLTVHSSQVADCKIIAPAPILLQLLLTTNKEDLLASSSIIIVGKTSIAFTLGRILDSLQPDWHYELSQWVGTVTASTIINSLKAGKEQLAVTINFIKHHMSNIGTNIHFSNEIDKLAKTNPVTDLLSLLKKPFRQS